MINYISKPFKWFFKLEAASGLILLISAILALIISNSAYSSYYFGYLEKYIFVVLNGLGGFPLLDDSLIFDILATELERIFTTF